MKLWRHKATQSIRTGEPRSRFFMQVKPLIVLLCLGLMFYVYSNWQNWLEKLDDRPISAFNLVGTPAFTTDEDVRDMLIKMGDLKGFFGQDVSLVREQIQKMPWVKQAVVRKIWPDRLNILVSEYTPVAVWNDNEFLSSDGVVFKLPVDKLQDKNLPHLAGPDYQSLVVLDAWKKIYQDLKTKGLTLKSVAIDDREAWQLELDNGVLLKLGRGEWKSKLDRFATIYPQIEVPENKKLSYVDLRYKVGAAVGMVDINE
ncbi:Cell division protein FtsQ [uncultured Avibacterium sp.]|uniref:Cell division protein FtsQ n=2 Tax=Avibacterium TaxID=292486 RepID=A0A447SQ94_AVIVO|nr:cell division protein FtsQ/DivIB [Avibacterium volantium]VEB23439.1 Cell division protein FtsQ [Avibacterium volantium]VGM95550.1 Cell division protein FtsQ [uncultured Avibacterium sp.]